MSEMQKLGSAQGVLNLPQLDIDHGSSAYTQFFELAYKSQNLLLSSQLAWAENAIALQERALDFAKTNASANLGLMADLSHATSLTDCLEIQARFARRQSDELGKQAEELGALMVTSTKPNGRRH